MDAQMREWVAMQADIIRRLEALERSGGLSHASIEGGAIDIYDDDDTYRGSIGNLPDGTVGVIETNGPVPDKPTPPLVTTRLGMAIVAWRTAGMVNYAHDPTFENGLDGWIGNGGAVVALGGPGIHGTYKMGVRWQPGATVTRDLSDLGLTPGEFYTVAIDVDTAAGPIIEMRVSGDDDVASTETMTDRLEVSFRMGAAAPVVTLTGVSAAPNSETWFDTWSVTPGTAAGPYFDGDSDGYEWLGAPHGSPSYAVEFPPSDIRHAQVHIDSFPGFVPSPDTFQGAILPGGGPLSTPLPVGVLRYVKIVLVTQSGQTSPPSDPTPVRIRAIERPDLGPGAVGPEAIGAGAIQEAHMGFTFDFGQITVTYGPDPHNSPRLNDMWWDSENGYQPNRWDGDSWVPMEFGSQALAVDSVTARQIVAGAVTAGHIAAGAVSTEKLSVGAVAAGASRIRNFGFETLTEPTNPAAGFFGWDLHIEAGTALDVSWASVHGLPIKGSYSAWVALDTTASVGRVVNGEPIAVRPGETWSVSALCRASRVVDNPSGFALIAQTSDLPQNINNPLAVGTLWQEVGTTQPTLTDQVISGQFDIPEGARYLAIGCRLGPGDTFGGWSGAFDEVVLQPVVSGVQIANGAIRAEHITADAIGTEHLQAGSISGEEIAGQIILGTTFVTPEVDDAGNPIGYSTISREGYEGQGADRRLRHRLSNTDARSYYEGDANIAALTVTEKATLDADLELARGKNVRLASSTAPPGEASALTKHYDTFALDPNGARWAHNYIGARGGRPTTDVTPTHPFRPAQVAFMTARAHDNRFVAVTHAHGGSRIWTFNESGGVFSVDDWPNLAITGYINDGAVEMFIATNVNNGRCWLYDRVNNVRTEIATPGDIAPTLAQAWEDTVPGGSTDPGRFYLIRKRIDNWEFRVFRFDPTNLTLTGYGPRTFLATTHVAPWAGSTVGQFDYTDGVTRLIGGLWNRNTGPVVYDVADGSETNAGLDRWPSAATGRVGFCWNNGSFYDLTADGTMYRYSSEKWVTGPADAWFAATLRDSDPAGTGTHETTLGVKRRITRVKRANIRVTLPPVPRYDPPDPDNPNQWRLYAVYANAPTTPPADSAFRLQGEGVATSVVIGAFNAAGAAPPTVNNFPQIGASEVASTELWAGSTEPKVYVRGDGVQNIFAPGMICLWPSTATPPKGFARVGQTVPRAGDYSAVAERFPEWVSGTNLVIPDLPAFGTGLRWVIKL